MRLILKLFILAAVLVTIPRASFAVWLNELESGGTCKYNIVDHTGSGKSSSDSYTIGPWADYHLTGDFGTLFALKNVSFQCEVTGYVINKLRWSGSHIPGGVWILLASTSNGSTVPGMTADYILSALNPDSNTYANITLTTESASIRQLFNGIVTEVETQRTVEHPEPGSVGAYNLRIMHGNKTQPIWFPIDRTSGRIIHKTLFKMSVAGSAANFYEFTGNLNGSAHLSVLTKNAKGQPEWKFALLYASATPKADPAHGGALNGPDPVNVETGEYLYMPAPDIAAYNPCGPSVLYRRNYCGLRANMGYRSPGLSIGWVDNFDVRLSQSGGLDDPYITLTFPTGGCDTFYPTQTSAGKPVRTFEAREDEGSTEIKHVPYTVTGVPNSSGGGWQSVTVEWKDGTKWGFELASECKRTPKNDYLPTYRQVYYLTSIANKLGRKVIIVRGGNGLVSSVKNDAGKTLLGFTYKNNQLSAIRDCYGRKVMYSYGPSKVTGMPGDLIAVSKLALGDPKQIASHWTYTYENLAQKFEYGQNLYAASQPYLKTISFPNPAGTGITEQKVEYMIPVGEGYPKVKAFIDGNRNRTEYAYNGNSTTVSFFAPDGTPKEQKKYDYSYSRLDRVSVLKNGESKYPITYTYSDSRFQYPTQVTSGGSTVTVTYDDYGNVTSQKGGRSGSIEYTYEYPDSCPMGRVVEVIEAKSATDRKVASVLQYDARGLVEYLYSLSPLSTSTNLVYSKTKLEYDTLGNVTKVTSLSPGGPDTCHTETYTYCSNGSSLTREIKVLDGPYTFVSYDYGPNPKMGQPVSATDSVTGFTSTYSYDARGNVIGAKNALGAQTDYLCNIADQLFTVTYPGVEK